MHSVGPMIQINNKPFPNLARRLSGWECLATAESSGPTNSSHLARAHSPRSSMAIINPSLILLMRSLKSHQPINDTVIFAKLKSKIKKYLK